MKLSNIHITHVVHFFLMRILQIYYSRCLREYSTLLLMAVTMLFDGSGELSHSHWHFVSFSHHLPKQLPLPLTLITPFLFSTLMNSSFYIPHVHDIVYHLCVACLFHWTLYPPGLSILLKMTGFPSFKGNSILLCIQTTQSFSISCWWTLVFSVSCLGR